MCQDRYDRPQCSHWDNTASQSALPRPNGNHLGILRLADCARIGLESLTRNPKCLLFLQQTAPRLSTLRFWQPSKVVTIHIKRVLQGSFIHEARFLHQTCRESSPNPKDRRKAVSLNSTNHREGH